MSTTAPSAYTLEKIVSAAQQTIEALRTEHGLVIETDDELLTALAEEKVDIPRVLTLLFRASVEAESLAEAAKARMADLKQRMDRFVRNQQAARDLAQQVMESVGLRSFKNAEVTASLSVGRPKVIVTDPDALPDDMVTVTRTPNKAAILTALAAGEVRGATLSNATTVLRIVPK